MLDCLCICPFSCLDVTDLYAIHLHLKLGWQHEYVHGDGHITIQNVQVWVALIANMRLSCFDVHERFFFCEYMMYDILVVDMHAYDMQV